MFAVSSSSVVHHAEGPLGRLLRSIASVRAANSLGNERAVGSGIPWSLERAPTGKTDGVQAECGRNLASCVPRVLAIVVTSVVIGLGGLGCVTFPKTGVQATGEPLEARVETKRVFYNDRVKVGETVHRDSSGRMVGTSAEYAMRTNSYDFKVWENYQGEKKIDDEDFFRIAGDVEAANEIRGGRRFGKGLLVAGATMTLTGVILGIAGGVIDRQASATTTGSTSGTSKPGMDPTAAKLVLAGGILVPVGVVTWYWGAAKVDSEHPVDDPKRAIAAAKKYNDALAARKAALEEEAAAEEERKEAEEAEKARMAKEAAEAKKKGSKAKKKK